MARPPGQVLRTLAGVDYRELLAKYMRHVGECEGTDFVHSLNDTFASDQVFTPDEVAELNRISDEVIDGPVRDSGDGSA